MSVVFFFQAEDGIRDLTVTGVQTCALPISEQDESGHRPGGRVEGAAPPADGLVRPDLIGLPVYKMTGSGNDFVILDARVSSPADWTPRDMQAVCARGTGIGADGIVFVGPEIGRASCR